VGTDSMAAVHTITLEFLGYISHLIGLLLLDSDSKYIDDLRLVHVFDVQSPVLVRNYHLAWVLAGCNSLLSCF